MANIIDVKKIIEKEKLELKERIKSLKEKGVTPKLVVILVGENEASRIYIQKKEVICEELGIEFEDLLFDENVEEKTLIGVIDKLNDNNAVSAILIQLPLPQHIDSKKVMCRVNHKKDVDGFHPINLGMLLMGNESIVPCTAVGIISILDSTGVDYEGKKCTVIGRSLTVGKPVSNMLLNRNCTVTICHSKTEDLAQHTKEADILIAAIGQAEYITGDMVKEGAIVIDVGINRIDGKIVGDVKFDEVKEKVSYITKVPGSVGPMTILMLAKNIVCLTEKANK